MWIRLAMSLFLLVVLIVPPTAAAGKDDVAYADLDARRTRADDFLARKRLRDEFISERVMSRNQVKEFLDDLELELSYLEVECKAQRKKCEQLNGKLDNLKSGISGIRKHPYCLGYNVSLLANMNSIMYLATVFQVIDIRTLARLNKLTVKESDHVGGMSSLLETELLCVSKME